MEKVEKSPKKSGWGIGIFALYGGFVLFMIIIVVVASFQNFDLVENDYYEKGLAYQDKIDKTSRTNTLTRKPELKYDAANSDVVISYPPECVGDSLDGTILLYRPSNSRWDREYPVGITSDNRQIISAESLVPGLWKVKINWIWRGQSYYYESKIMITDGN